MTAKLTIDIYSDVMCPWCVIGYSQLKKGLAELEGEIAAEVRWLPYELNPDMPPEGMTRDDYVRAKFGGGDRPRQIYQAIAESGREAGIDFQFSRIRRTPNTVLSHRLVHWSARHGAQDQVVAGLFRLYFEEGRDIGDVETLVECAMRCGIDELATRRFLASDEGRQEVIASDVYARRLGINGVPCFIVNRKYAVSGAQPPSAFVEVFNRAERDAATSAAQSTA